MPVHLCSIWHHCGLISHITLDQPCLQAWVPKDEVMLVHSFGLGWDEVTASNLLAVDKVLPTSRRLDSRHACLPCMIQPSS